MAILKFSTDKTLPVLLERGVSKEGRNLRFYIGKDSGVTFADILTILQDQEALKDITVYDDTNTIVEVDAGYTELVNFAMMNDAYEIILNRPNDEATIEALSNKVAELAVTADSLKKLSTHVNEIDTNNATKFENITTSINKANDDNNSKFTDLNNQIGEFKDVKKTIDKNSGDITDLQIALADIYESITPSEDASDVTDDATTDSTDAKTEGEAPVAESTESEARNG